MPDLVGSSLSANGAELTQTCKRDKSNVTGCAVFCRTNDILTSHFYTFHEENEVLTQTFRLPGGTNRSECANVPLRNGELVNSNTTPQCIIIKGMCPIIIMEILSAFITFIIYTQKRKNNQKKT